MELCAVQLALCGNVRRFYPLPNLLVSLLIVYLSSWLRHA